MTENTRALFTIGQFAALHGINKKTLMWYDQVGLLKPAVVKENGYRCYTHAQSSVLETILLLRDLDLSIPKIRDFLQAPSAQALDDLLGEGLAVVEEKLRHLRGVKRTLLEQREDVRLLFDLDLSQIQVVEREPEKLVLLKTTKDTSLEREIEMVLSATKRLNLPHLHDASYGAVIGVERLYQGDYTDYEALYIKLPQAKRQTGLHYKPGGKYLQAFFRGRWEDLPQRYEQIMAYARREGLTLTGYAYEAGLNDMVIRDPAEYITQIEIPLG